MIDSMTLASSLAAAAGMGSKTASIYAPVLEKPPVDAKLQAIIGDPGEQQSIFAQTSPDVGNHLLPNPFSPFQGDEVFFTYLIPGARFASHDGQWFEIDAYSFGEGSVSIHNVWYPRMSGIVSVQDIRKSIAQWIHPVQQTVPPIPIDVDYGVIETRIVE
jgi:hypothetical protein